MAKLCIQIILLFGISNIIFAQQNVTNQNQISVIGSIELKKIADEASFYFTIKGVGESLREAVEDAENKTKTITDKILEIGIEKSDISTSDFISGENYGDKAFLSSSRDYKAIIVTKIKTDSLGLIQPLLFTISESEVESISNIYFSVKDELGLRRQARIEAGLKAKEKAEDIANALGVKVGKVLRIEEVQSTQSFRSPNQDLYFRGSVNYPNPFNQSTSFNSNEISIDETKGSGFFAQTVSITSQVKVIFALE